jgi:phospholipid N-methyltransferase
MSEFQDEYVEQSEPDTQAVSMDESAPEPVNQALTEANETGDPDVDAVVSSLNGLDDLPVTDHVAVFEQAHESLRRTLAGAGQDSPAAGRS